MEDDFELIDTNFYGYFLLGDKLSNLDMNNTKLSLALFNFFGTLVWGEDSYLYNYDKILPSSPLIKENLSIIQDRGYTLCVIEYVPLEKISKFKYLMNVFYQSLDTKVSVFFFIYTKKDVNIYSGLLKFFNPEKQRFGKSSFYCGFQAGKFNMVPWFRYCDKDLQLSTTMNFQFYDPIEVLGTYVKPSYAKNILYIVCGPEYSGYEIEYETFRSTQKYENIIFKYKKDEDTCTDVYSIYLDDIDKKNDLIKNKICVKDKAIIVFGLNETKEKRDKIKDYFQNYDLCIVHWYSRFPYKKSKSFNEYKQKFQNPLLQGELFERMS